MRRLLAPVVAALALLAAFTACNSHPPLTGLSVEVTKLERQADGGITATLQFVNSSVVAFNIASSKHQLLLDGRIVGNIDIHEPLGLPAQHNMTQTGRLVLVGGDLPAGNASYQLNSSLSFVLSGEQKEVQKFTTTGTVVVP